MMKILYIENSTSNCNYYNDIIKYLSKYSILKKIKKDINKNIRNFQPNIIILGFSLTDCGNDYPEYFKTPPIEAKNKCVPIYIILNKEYIGLNKKLKWIKNIDPKKVFTVHHDYKKYEEICKIPFTRIMWSANHEIFKPYTTNYKYDLFFSGIIRKEQTNNLRNKIYNKLNNIKNYKLLIKVGFYNGKIMKGNCHSFNNIEYAKQIDMSKIILTTTGPADLVGTRYFEIMASNKALILCNRMNKEVYSDYIIDKFNCVMFDNENDFIEKFKYYIEHGNARLKIVNQAYEYFKEKLTWDTQVNFLLENL